MPFGSTLIYEIIESQWFSTTSRSQADAGTTARIVRERDIPIPIVILVVISVRFSCIFNALV
jgi:hypothetical protein